MAARTSLLPLPFAPEGGAPERIGEAGFELYLSSAERRQEQANLQVGEEQDAEVHRVHAVAGGDRQHQRGEHDDRRIAFEQHPEEQQEGVQRQQEDPLLADMGLHPVEQLGRDLGGLGGDLSGALVGPQLAASDHTDRAADVLDVELDQLEADGGSLGNG